jgi:general stress protein 26
MTDADARRKDALGFLTRHAVGVLATVDSAGQPHASAVYYKADDDFSIYFLTLASSKKYQGMKANPKVAFTIGSSDVPKTLQMEGVAEEIQYEEDKNAKLTELVGVLMDNSKFYFPPLTQLDKAEVVLIWMQPKWARWSDFSTMQDGTDKVTFEIQL